MASFSDGTRSKRRSSYDEIESANVPYWRKIGPDFGNEDVQYLPQQQQQPQSQQQQQLYGSRRVTRRGSRSAATTTSSSSSPKKRSGNTTPTPMLSSSPLDLYDHDHDNNNNNNANTYTPISLPEAAHWNYGDLARQGPPQLPMAETFEPHLVEALRKPTVWVVPYDFPKSPVREEQVYLTRREDPQQAFRRLAGKASVSLNHHGTGWGYVVVALILERVQLSDHPFYVEILSQLPPPPHGSWIVFEEPHPRFAEFVAIKTLGRQIVDRYLANGGNENPYKEIARMQQYGDNQHVLGCVDAMLDANHLYIITPFCEELTLKDNIQWKLVMTQQQQQQQQQQQPVTDAVDMDQQQQQQPGVPDTSTPPTSSSTYLFDQSFDSTLPEETCREWFVQILQNLAYLQHHGICHHDVSPDNLVRYKGRWVLFDMAMSLRVPLQDNPSQDGNNDDHHVAATTSMPIEVGSSATTTTPLPRDDNHHQQQQQLVNDPVKPDDFTNNDNTFLFHQPSNKLLGHPNRYLIAPIGNFGTPAYMAPEVFMNSIPFDGHGIDLWAAAVILYNLLTGHILYYRPHPVDLLFRYCLQARGLSQQPSNDRTMEILMDYYAFGDDGGGGGQPTGGRGTDEDGNDHEDDPDDNNNNDNTHRPLDQDGTTIRPRRRRRRRGAEDNRNRDELMSRAMAHLRISSEAMLLLENLLQLDPHQRWTLEQAMHCNWVQPPPPPPLPASPDAVPATPTTLFETDDLVEDAEHAWFYVI